MKLHCGYPEFRVGLSLLLLRCLRPLQAIAVALLLLGLPNNASTGHAKTDSGSDVHVYLIRGVLNVFSLGLDQIAARLRQQGIPATVHNHMFWAPLAAEAAAEYSNGRVRRIILVGHSSGATVLPDMVGQLSRLGVPVALAIGLDSVFQTSLAGRVGRYVNFYIANGVGTRVEKTSRFLGALENVDVQNIPGIGHITIDKNDIIQQKVISEIHSVVRGGPKKPSPRHKQLQAEASARQSPGTAGASATAGR
jgi:hypothetical protein